MLVFSKLFSSLIESRAQLLVRKEFHAFVFTKAEECVRASKAALLFSLPLGTGLIHIHNL